MQGGVGGRERKFISHLLQSPHALDYLFDGARFRVSMDKGQ